MIDKDLAKDLRVMIVDDLPSARRVTRKLLNNLKIEDILEAKDGAKAWEMLKKERVDLIISDWRMPDIEGIELCKKIRGDVRFTNLPFIMMTSYSDKDIVLASIEAGVSDFIAKPFNSQILADKINGVLRKKEEKEKGKKPAE